MAETLVWYESDDATLLTAPALSAIVPPGAAAEWHLYNPGTNSLAQTSIRVWVEARIVGGSTFEGADLPPLDDRWVELSITGTTGPNAPAAVLTPWMGVGAGAWLDVQDLPVDSGAIIMARANPPVSTQGATYEIAIRVASQPAMALALGFSETSADGILSGLGDPARYELVVGGAVTQQTVPDGTVQAPYFAWIEGGVPFAASAGNVTVSATDGASATTGSGEEYYALLVGLGGVLAQVKGVKAATGTAIRPPVPARAVPIAYVRRDGTAMAIADSDITNVGALGRLSLTSGGLTIFLGPGWARVDNSLLVFSGRLQALLEASTTTRVYLGRQGNLLLAATTDPNPERRALPLYDVTTSGSAVTAVVDLRAVVHRSPARRVLRISGAAGNGATGAPEFVDGARPLYLDPWQPLAVALGDLGTTPLSGVERVDVLACAPGGSYVSIFGGGTGTMPAIAWNATDLSTAASSPSALVIPAGYRYRAKVDVAPTATAPPDDVAVVLNGAVG